jgi:membrane protein DedA with SNARE-associated domain
LNAFDWTLDPENLARALPVVLLVIVVLAILQDDLTCVLVGVYVSQGDIPFWPSLIACFVGTLLGDLAWFFLARVFGRLLLDRRPVSRLISTENLKSAQALFERYGKYTIIVTRFLPGSRTLVQIAAGLFPTEILTTCLYFLYAAALYTLLLVGSCTLLGRTVNVELLYQQYGHLALLAAAVAVWCSLLLIKLSIRRLSVRRETD